MSGAERFAYLHGFGSSALSTKGQHLARVFKERGLDLELPDLNQPSFERLSHDAALASVTAMDEVARTEGDTRLEHDESPRWCLVGSSFGGWLAARWAELHSERVERLILLCPGFHFNERWPELLGPAKMAEWGRVGTLAMPDGSGELRPVHYDLYVEALRQPPAPSVPVPTLIIHGTRDEVVPVHYSRRYAAARPHVTLREVDDDHSLAASVELIAEATLEFFLR